MSTATTTMVNHKKSSNRNRWTYLVVVFPLCLLHCRLRLAYLPLYFPGKIQRKRADSWKSIAA